MKRQSGCVGGGCMTFLAGLVAGAALMILALVGWAFVRPVSLAPLRNTLEPGGTELEVRMSEAYLNREAAGELAKRHPDNVTRIILDAHPERRLGITLEGHFELAGVVPVSPKLDVEAQLGVQDGLLAVQIEQVGVGPVRIARNSLPESVQPLFQSAEATIEQIANERLQAEGFQARDVQSDEDSLTLGLKQTGGTP
jgi:hypothetical protein